MLLHTVSRGLKDSGITLTSAKMFRSSLPEMFCKKVILRNFTKFIGKKTRVNFAKLLRTPFLKEHLRWLLLIVTIVALTLENGGNSV